MDDRINALTFPHHRTRSSRSFRWLSTVWEMRRAGCAVIGFLLLAIGICGEGLAASDISTVTVTQASGTYTTGQTLTIHVVFDVSMNVSVAGTNPTISLNSGGTATYLGGSQAGISTMDFSYTIGSGDTAAALATTTTPVITLSGGATIVLNSDGMTNADLAYAPANLQNGSGGGYAINPPQTLQGLTVASNGQNDVTGQAILLSATFDGNVVVSGVPTIALSSGGTATYASGSGSTVLSFVYIVGAADSSAGLACSNTSAPITLSSGATISNSDNTAVAAVLALSIPGAILSSVNAQPTTINDPPTAATISSLSVVQAGGTYYTDSALDITVTFSSPVVVDTTGGTPSLALNSKGTDANATAIYSSGSGSDTLTFHYLVAAGNSCASGTFGNLVNAVTLNGGTITDLNFASTNASTTLAAGTLVSAANGQPFTIVSEAPATVTGISVAQGNGNYDSGQSLTINVTFSGAVDVTGTPTLALNSGSTLAYYSSGAGSATLAFTYVIGASDSTALLDIASTTPIALPGSATILNHSRVIPANLACTLGAISGSQTISINATSAATITALSVVQAGGTYYTDSALDISVTFSVPVSVNATGGTPSLALNSQGSDAHATAIYSSGSGSNILTFHYLIAAGNSCAAGTFGNLINGLALNAGTITNLGSPTTNAILSLVAGTLHSAANGQTFTIVSQAPDTVTGVSVAQGNGNYSSGQSLTIDVAFSGPVSVTGTPTMALNSGSTLAYYSSGSGSSTLAFTYTIGAADAVTKLDVASPNPIALPGGATILNSGTEIPANLACAVGSISCSQSISINEVQLTITGITVGVAGGNYFSGSVLPIQVVFSGNVQVSGAPTIALNTGESALYSASGSTATTLLFNYTVQASDYAAALNLSNSSPAITLNGGTITDTTADQLAANLDFGPVADLVGNDGNPLSINAPPVPYLGGGTTADVSGLTFPPATAPFETILAGGAAIGPGNAANYLIQSLTITLVDHPDGTAESLGISSGVTLTAAPYDNVTIGTFDNLTGSLIITVGNASTASGFTMDGGTFLPILQNIVYRNSSPTTATPGPRQVNFQLTDTNGRTSAISIATLTVGTGLPVVTLNGATANTTLLYTQGSGAVPFCPSASINNPTPAWVPEYDYSTGTYSPYYLYQMIGTFNLIEYEGSVLDSVTITMTNPDGTGIFPSGTESISFTPLPNYVFDNTIEPQPAGNFLAFTGLNYDPYPMFSVTGNTPVFTATSQTVTIAGSQTAAQMIAPNMPAIYPIPTNVMQGIIQSLTYSNSSSNPTQFGVHRLLNIVVTNTSTSSPATTSVAASCLITINPTNVAPVIALAAPVAGTSPAYPAILQGAQNTPLTGIAISDQDGNDNSETLTISVQHGTVRTASAGPAASIVMNGALDANGGALNNALASLTYTPDALYNGSDTLTLSLDDNGHSSPNPSDPVYALTATQTITIPITATNQPPQITLPSEQVGSENASITFNQPIQVSDPDLTGTGVLQVSLSVAHGTISLASTANLDFSFTADVFGAPLGPVAAGQPYQTMLFRGAINDIDAALSQITYQGQANFYGLDVVTVQVNDLGQFGQWDSTPQIAGQVVHGPASGPTAQSWTVTSSFNVNVAFVNQIPQIAANNALLVPAGNSRPLTGGSYTAPVSYPLLGQPLNPIQTPYGPPGSGTVPLAGGASNLVAQDVETVDARGLTYTIVLAPTQGTLTLSGASLAASGTFTQDDLNNGRVYYVHDGAIKGNDSFVFTCSDDNGSSHPVGASDTANGVNSNLNTNIFTINISRLNPEVIFSGPIPLFLENPGTPVIIDNNAQTAVYNESDPTAFVTGGGIGSMTVTLSIPVPATLPAGFPAYTDSQDVLDINPPPGGAITAAVISGAVPKAYSLTYTSSGTTIPIGQLTTGSGTVALSVVFSSQSNIPVDAVTQVLHALTFSSPSKNPSAAAREITVVVTNSAGYSSPPVTKEIDVLPFDNPPTIAVPPVPAGYDVPRVTITGPVGASDTDSIMTYSVSTAPVKGTVTVSNNTWSYTAFAASSGTDSFSITVSDLGIPSNLTPTPTPVTQTYQIQITPVGMAGTPLILSNALMEIEEGDNLSYTPTVSTSGNLSFQLIGLSAAGVGFNSGDGTITWPGVPLPSLLYYNFGIMVTDTTTQLSSYQPILLKVFAAGSSNN